MKKISLFGAVSTGVGMLIATSCFVSSASGSSAVGTPFVIAIVHSVYSKYACGFVDSRIKCDNA